MALSERAGIVVTLSLAAVSLSAASLTVAVGALAGCSGTSDTDDVERGTPTFDGDELPAVAQELVDAHNAVRAGAQPSPNPALPPLVWSEALAEIAQQWSERCVFEHSTNDHGENLAYFTGDNSTATDAVQIWADEHVDYDLQSNSCAPNRQCGHYTQIVWRNSTQVGCGISDCDMLGAEGRYWVCNYDPPGNFIGERPY